MAVWLVIGVLTVTDDGPVDGINIAKLSYRRFSVFYRPFAITEVDLGVHVHGSPESIFLAPESGG